MPPERRRRGARRERHARAPAIYGNRDGHRGDHRGLSLGRSGGNRRRSTAAGVRHACTPSADRAHASRGDGWGRPVNGAGGAWPGVNGGGGRGVNECRREKRCHLEQVGDHRPRAFGEQIVVRHSADDDAREHVHLEGARGRSRELRASSEGAQREMRGRSGGGQRRSCSPGYRRGRATAP